MQDNSHCGPQLASFRRLQLSVLSQVVDALADLNVELRQCMPRTVRKIAGSKSPAFMALLVAVLRWPDRALALCFIQGFRTVGDIEPSQLFRQLPPPSDSSSSMSVNDFLGYPAVAAVDSIEHSPPPKSYAGLAVRSRGHCEWGSPNNR